MIKKKAIALIQEKRNLLICTFELECKDADEEFEFMDTCRFHFEERVSEPERHASHIMVDYFDKGLDADDDFVIKEIVEVE